MRNLQITQSITDRDSHVVESYLQDIAKVDLITANEEVELTRKIKQGDRAALEKLVKANLRFVVSVAKKYQNQGLPLSDLISEGNGGLIKAAQRFDETKGFKFISFAVWWIRQAIMQAIADQSRMVRLPMNQISVLTKMKQYQFELEQQLERTPEHTELAGYMGTKESKLREAVYFSARTVSYDAPLNSGEDYSLIDTLKTEQEGEDERLINESIQQNINHLLGGLTRREKQVIEMTFGLKTFAEQYPEEIATQLGITPERVRQIRRKGMEKLIRMAEGKQALFFYN